MTELNYKASNIAKAERLHGANFFKTLQGLGEEAPSLSGILFILEAGGLTEDEAGAVVDDKGLVGAIQAVVESLSASGFLGKTMDSAEVQKAMSEASQSSGSSKKA